VASKLVSSGLRPSDRRPSRAHVALMVCVILLSACSVSTPRNGRLTVGAGSTARTQAGGNALADDGGSLQSDASTAGGSGDAAAVGADASAAGGDGAAGAGGAATDAGSASSVGVTDSTISLSIIGSFSGPYGAIYQQQYAAAALTWRDDVNARGGINGRKIELKQVDDQFSVEGAVAACKAVQSNGTFAAETLGTADNGIACLDSAGIPTVPVTMTAGDPLALGWHHVRSLGTADAYGEALAHFVATSSGLGRQGHKIGLIYTTDSPVPAGTADGFLATASKLGLDVHVEKIVVNQPTFTAEMQRMRDAGVDTVVMSCVFEAIGILRDSKAIAYNPMFTGWFFDADEVSAGGAAVFQGIKAPRFWASADSAAYQAFKAKVAQYGESPAPSTTYQIAYGGLLVIERGLELAGRNLTRGSFEAALDQIQGFDTGVVPPITFGAGRAVGSHAAFPLECCSPDNTWRGIGPSSDFTG
jgi:branched-chain amino acid transport system substrate-binding protein